MKVLFTLIIHSFFVLSLIAATANAQDRSALEKLTEETKSNEFRFRVKHDHLRKFCQGELVINDDGIEYITDFEQHQRYWDFVDIKLLKLISKNEIEVQSYSTYRPKLTLNQSLKLGRNESFRFKLLEGELTQNVSEFLQRKIKKPFATTFVAVNDESDPPVFALRVQHRHRWGSCPGILKAYGDKLIFQSYTEPTDSRLWRWSDLQGMGRSGPYKFELITYEPQLGGPEKSYNFDLKEEMTDKMYDFLWKKFYKVTYYQPAVRMP